MTFTFKYRGFVKTNIMLISVSKPGFSHFKRMELCAQMTWIMRWFCTWLNALFAIESECVCQICSIVPYQSVCVQIFDIIHVNVLFTKRDPVISMICTNSVHCVNRELVMICICRRWFCTKLSCEQFHAVFTQISGAWLTRCWYMHAIWHTVWVELFHGWTNLTEMTQLPNWQKGKCDSKANTEFNPHGALSVQYRNSIHKDDHFISPYMEGSLYTGTELFWRRVFSVEIEETLMSLSDV